MTEPAGRCRRNNAWPPDRPHRPGGAIEVLLGEQLYVAVPPELCSNNATPSLRQAGRVVQTRRPRRGATAGLSAAN